MPWTVFGVHLWQIILIGVFAFLVSFALASFLLDREIIGRRP